MTSPSAPSSSHSPSPSPSPFPSPSLSLQCDLLVSPLSSLCSVALSRRSYSLYACGTEDASLSLYKTSRPSPLLRLAGCSAPITSLAFDSVTESLLSAGSSMGPIKLFDLEGGRLLRTLAGHRSSVDTMDFHPFGGFFASGSADQCVKMWDIRMKSTIHSYKSHQARVTCVKHSPDGKWLLSGDERGALYVWEITTGKVLTSLSLSSCINSLDFHPSEFIMCVGAEKSVEWWELEPFVRIEGINKGAAVITFNTTGEECYIARRDECSIDRCNYEPYSPLSPLSCVHQSYNSQLNSIRDMAIDPQTNTLIAIATSKNVLNLFTADTKHLAAPSAEHSANASFPTPHSPKKSPTSSPVASSLSPSKSSSPSPSSSSSSSIKNKPNVAFFRAHQQDSSLFLQPPQASSHPPGSSAPSSSSSSSSPSGSSVPPSSSSISPLQSTLVPTENLSTPLGISPSSFAPSATLLPAPSSGPPSLSVAADQIRSSLLVDHEMMRRVLAERLVTVRILADLWEGRGPKGGEKGAEKDQRRELFNTLQRISKSSNPQVVVDFLNSAETALYSSLTLEESIGILALVSPLLDSRFESYVYIAMKYVLLMINSFSSVLHSYTQHMAAQRLGSLDLSGEERANKSERFVSSLHSLMPKITPRAKKQSTVGALASEITQKATPLLSSFSSSQVDK